MTRGVFGKNLYTTELSRDLTGDIRIFIPSLA